MGPEGTSLGNASAAPAWITATNQGPRADAVRGLLLLNDTSIPTPLEHHLTDPSLPMVAGFPHNLKVSGRMRVSPCPTNTDQEPPSSQVEGYSQLCANFGGPDAVEGILQLHSSAKQTENRAVTGIREPSWSEWAGAGGVSNHKGLRAAPSCRRSAGSHCLLHRPEGSPAPTSHTCQR